MKSQSVQSNVQPNAVSCQICGTIRRRRNFSKLLTFITLECAQDKDQEGIAETSIQLVCDGWSVPRPFVAGVTINSVGIWEQSIKGKRFLVKPDGLSIIVDAPISAAGWKKAAEHASFRARTRELCDCTDILCTKWHGDANRWLERRNALQQRRIMEKNMSRDINDVHQETPAAKAKHNFVFSTWVLETFEKKDLMGGVVDIAGGRGLISLQLALDANLPVVLVEPCELKLNKTYRKRIRKFWKRKCNNTDTIECVTKNIVSEIDTNNSILENSNHMNRSEDSKVINMDADAVQRLSEGGCDAQGQAFEIRECKNDQELDDAVSDVAVKLPIEHYREEFYGINTASDSVRQAILSSAVLLAMHPDSATGAVVATAVQYKKPFAVVPCCVFTHLFPERKTPSGQSVSTYEELLEYLQAMDPIHIKRTKLPFEGRNIVLYCTGYD